VGSNLGASAFTYYSTEVVTGFNFTNQETAFSYHGPRKIGISDETPVHMDMPESFRSGIKQKQYGISKKLETSWTGNKQEQSVFRNKLEPSGTGEKPELSCTRNKPESSRTGNKPEQSCIRNNPEKCHHTLIEESKMGVKKVKEEVVNQSSQRVKNVAASRPSIQVK